MIKSTPHFLISFAHEFTFDESYIYWGRFWFFAQLGSRLKTLRKGEVTNESSDGWWRVFWARITSFEDANIITERRVLFDEEFPSWRVLHREWMNEWNSGVLIRVRIEHPIPITNDSMKRGWKSHFGKSFFPVKRLGISLRSMTMGTTSCEIGRSSSFLPLSISTSLKGERVRS